MTTRLAFILLWLYVFSIPVTYATEIPLIGAISTATGLAAMGAALIAVVARRQVRGLGPVHMAMAAFILWSAATLCWSVAPDLTVHRVMNYLQLFVLVLLVWEMCVEEKDVLSLLSAFVLGGMIPALATVKGFLPGQMTLLQRSSTAGYDANQLAFLLALSLPAAYYLILREKGPIVSLYRLQMGFAICAILLTGSASSMIAMAVGLSLVFWTFHTVLVRTRNNAFATMVLLAVATIVFMPSKVWRGVIEETRKGDIEVTTVMNMEVQSLRSTPLMGLGAGTQGRPAVAMSYSLGGRPTSFTMFAETGMVGLACSLAVLAVLTMTAGRMTGTAKSFWLTTLAVWVVGVFSLNWDCSQPAWLLFGLLAAHAVCLSDERARKSQRAEKRQRSYDEPVEVFY